MSNNNATAASGGVSVISLLGVLFVGLKLCGIIAWSWLWVLAPFWAPLAVVLVICFIMLGVFLAVHKK